MTIVINQKDRKYLKDEVWIDRTSKFGNPFKLSDFNNDREEVLRIFREWFYRNEELKKMVLDELAGKTVLCWCKPKKCHGDVYVEYINMTNIFDGE